MKLVLHPDSIKINGPKVDMGYSLTFNIGEYEKGIVAQLLSVNPEDIEQLEVSING